MLDHPRKERVVYVVSDSTGETAQRAVRVAFEQFGGVPLTERLFSKIRTQEELLPIIKAAAKEDALVVYTLVKDELHDAARITAEHLGVHAVNLMKELLPLMGDWLHKKPKKVPGHRLSEADIVRMIASNFAQNHDDGQCIEELCKADIVLLGLSRTSKTPLSHRLAWQGLKVANVPLVKEAIVPPEVFQVDPRRVFVLMMDAEKLRHIRIERLRSMGQEPNTNYVNAEHIAEEIRMVRRLLTKNHGWTVINVTNRAIEENESAILNKYQHILQQR